MHNDTIYNYCMHNANSKSVIMNDVTGSAKAIAKTLGLNVDGYTDLLTMLNNTALSKISADTSALDILCSYHYTLQLIFKYVYTSGQHRWSDYPIFFGILSNTLIKVMYNHASICEDYLRQMVQNYTNVDPSILTTAFSHKGKISASSVGTSNSCGTYTYDKPGLYLYSTYQGYNGGTNKNTVELHNCITGSSTSTIDISANRHTSICRFASKISIKLKYDSQGFNTDLVMIDIDL